MHPAGLSGLARTNARRGGWHGRAKLCRGATSNHPGSPGTTLACAHPTGPDPRHARRRPQRHGLCVFDAAVGRSGLQGRQPDGPLGKSRAKGKIVAFMAFDEAGTAVQVSFKIPPTDARSACERYDWIEPHSFRTLAPSGWVTATVATRRQVGTLTRFLKQSHADTRRQDRHAAGRRPQPSGEPRCGPHRSRDDQGSR